MTTARLEARALSASRGPVRLFSAVDLAVTGGEALAIEGPNGSGKTTLLRCVAGLTSVDAGEVLWEGRPAHDSDSGFRASVLYAGHLSGLKDDLTAEENLSHALQIRGAPVPRQAVHDALEGVGLGKRRLLPTRRLSAGQRRRIGLARLALDPADLWILDEPLASLDKEGERLLAERLENHLTRGGLALIATHHPLVITRGSVRRLSLAGA